MIPKRAHPDVVLAKVADDIRGRLVLLDELPVEEGNAPWAPGDLLPGDEEPPRVNELGGERGLPLGGEAKAWGESGGRGGDGGEELGLFDERGGVDLSSLEE